MSLLDREPRNSTGKSGPICERRVDPGIAGKPMRVDGPSRMSTKLQRGEDMTKAPKRMDVKR
jgi:hypothetical protein